nr:strigolactone esterase D14-like [Ipomoea batatas]
MGTEGLSKALNVRKVGSGEETVVLTHGFGADQSVWDKVVPRLAQSYQVVLFDWCFSGAVEDRSLFDADKYSSYEPFADDLIALLEELNLKSCVLVAHSMSGLIACIASIAKPHLFKKLILVCSSPRFLNDTDNDYKGGFEKSEVDQLLFNIETNFDQWTSGFANVAMGPKDPLSVEYLEKSFKKMGAQVGLAMAKAIFFSDYRSVLDKVTVQCTLIHAQVDFAVPLEVTTFMHQNIRGEATIKVVEGEGHFPQLTAHEEFLKAVLSALT